jgi:hypothetical protein
VWSTSSFTTTGTSTAYAIQVRWQATDTVPAPTHANSVTNTPSASGSDLPKKIGIGLGVPLAILVVLIIVGIVIFWRKKRPTPPDPPLTTHPPDPYYVQVGKAELSAAETSMNSTYNAAGTYGRPHINPMYELDSMSGPYAANREILDDSKSSISMKTVTPRSAI